MFDSRVRNPSDGTSCQLHGKVHGVRAGMVFRQERDFHSKSPITGKRSRADQVQGNGNRVWHLARDKSIATARISRKPDRNRENAASGECMKQDKQSYEELD